MGQQTNEIIEFNINEEQAQKALEESKSYALTDWKDEENYKLIKKKRLTIREAKKALHDKKREYKSFYETFLNKIESKAKSIKSPLDEADDYLTSQLNVRDDELKRQKAEEEARIQKEVERRDRLARSVQWDKPIYLLQDMSLEDFEREFEERKIQFEKQKAEEEENKRIREQFEKEQAEKMAKLQEENRELKRRQEEEAQQARLALKKKEDEERKIKEEAERLAKEDKLYNEVMNQFPTLTLAWAEIVRLKKELEVF